MSSFESKVLTPEATAFLSSLHRQFGQRRQKLLSTRHERQHLIDNGEYPKILPDSQALRSDLSWQVAQVPPDLICRWVEICGSPSKKTIINAMNSGADVFIADFEDGTSPTWDNIVGGQANLIEAVDKTISYTSLEGKHYALHDKTATLFCRPRGWHLIEKHFSVDGEPISASLFDFGLYVFHNAKKIAPYFYLSKLENHLEARLWNDVFIFAENELKIPVGTIRATVLIETILAIFEMEEILWELKAHSAGLAAGRWDYIFSIIKKFHKFPIVFPDRSAISSQAPFLKAAWDLLVRTAHKRGAHAIGGVSAFVPSRNDVEINKLAFAEVHSEKVKEAAQGFDGSWVAHPELVQLARDPFKKASGLRLNQIHFPLPYLSITPAHILNFKILGAETTETGVRNAIHVALTYFSAWLSGVGSLKIYHMIEDASTAEICRALLWQWMHHPEVVLKHIGPLTKEHFLRYLKIELNALEQGKCPTHLPQAKELLIRLVTEPNIPEFFTPVAYEGLEG